MHTLLRWSFSVQIKFQEKFAHFRSQPANHASRNITHRFRLQNHLVAIIISNHTLMVSLGLSNFITGWPQPRPERAADDVNCQWRLQQPSLEEYFKVEVEKKSISWPPPLCCRTWCVCPTLLSSKILSIYVRFNCTGLSYKLWHLILEVIQLSDYR